MNRQAIEEWIQALESGKYKQGLCVLKRPDDYYCCLGVLAELHADEWRTGTTPRFDDREIPHRANEPLSNDSGTLLAPAFAADIIGDLDQYNGIGYNARHLADLNDMGTSFLEIAQLLREALTAYDKENRS